MQTTTATLNHRDRAVLRAVAADRCEIPAGSGGSLIVDGVEPAATDSSTCRCGASACSTRTTGPTSVSGSCGSPTAVR